MPRPCRVLVVDDDHVIATTLAMILNRSGFEAVAAFSGREALKLAHASPFDILVTDVVMEPMNGVQLAVAFRNIYPGSHIYLFTGTIESAQQMAASAHARNDFHIFSKPLHPVQIIDALQAVWNPVEADEPL